MKERKAGKKTRQGKSSPEKKGWKEKKKEKGEKAAESVLTSDPLLASAPLGPFLGVIVCDTTVSHGLHRLFLGKAERNLISCLIAPPTRSIVFSRIILNVISATPKKLTSAIRLVYKRHLSSL